MHTCIHTYMQARAEADASLYRMAKEAEANKLRLTPELLQWEAVRALANNTKVVPLACLRGRAPLHHPLLAPGS